MRKDLLALGLVAAVAGCSARAESERRGAEAEPAEDIRIDREAIQSLLPPQHLASVIGTARASVEPDVAEISLGVTSSGATAPEAVRSNNQDMTKLIDALKARGVAARDIQTSQFSIMPRYNRPAEARPGVPEELTVSKVVGYDVANTVRVTSRDRGKIGDLIDAALQAGSNQMYGITFRLDDRETVLAGLRARAFDAAKAKAETYAKRAGMTLGPVYQITESDPSWTPDPSPMAANVMPAPAAAAPPVGAGDEEVTLSVTVVFELIAPKR